MTLIAAGIHKHQAFIVTDSRTTYVDTGKVHSEETSKSMMLDTGDGKVLIGYTGTASIESMDTIHWIADVMSKAYVNNLTINEVFDHLAAKLEYVFGNMAGGALGEPAPELIIIIAGWESAEGRHPILLELSNLEGYDKNNPVTTFSFKQHRPPMNQNGTGFYIAGDKRATLSSDFKGKSKAIKKLLNHCSNKLDARTEQELAKLVKIAADDPNSSTINDRVTTGRIGRRSNGLNAGFYPDDAQVKNYPGYVDGNIAVAGVKVVNDFVQGGTTVIGGTGSNLPPFLK